MSAQQRESTTSPLVMYCIPLVNHWDEPEQAPYRRGECLQSIIMYGMYVIVRVHLGIAYNIVLTAHEKQWHEHFATE